MVADPKTLQEAIQLFSTEENCIKYMVAKRWPNGVVVCPTCGSTKVGYLEKQRRFQCSNRHPKRQFSVKVGTIFEDSPLSLCKWLPCGWMIGNCKNGVSSREIHRALGVTQKTAWFVLHRIRLAMQDELTGGNLGGEVEVDETFIGGKARNMHVADKRRHGLKVGGPAGNTIVLGMLERGKCVRATVLPDRTKATMQPFIAANIEDGSQVYSDEHGLVWGMDEKFVHEIVNHMEAYVDGNVHTNGMENFWSLLKRGIGGTYVSVEPYHLFRYVDEQAFRFDNGSDGRRSTPLQLLIRKIVGKRLTYAELTAKDAETPEVPAC